MAEYTEQTFEEHLREEHTGSVFADYLKEIVYGGNDGIVTTFAVVAGFTGANMGADHMVSLSVLSVLLFGLANLFADGAAMGLGNFLSVRAEKSIYRSHEEKEWREITMNQEMEKKETRFILQKKGFSEEDAHTLTELFAKNPNYWLSFMMTEELALRNPEHESAALNGLATFTSFVVFGFIPILPYLFINDARQSFLWSGVATLSALAILGIFSGWVSGRNRFRTLLETITIGGISASIAFWVGTFF